MSEQQFRAWLRAERRAGRLSAGAHKILLSLIAHEIVRAKVAEKRA